MGQALIGCCHWAHPIVTYTLCAIKKFSLISWGWDRFRVVRGNRYLPKVVMEMYFVLIMYLLLDG